MSKANRNQAAALREEAAQASQTLVSEEEARASHIQEIVAEANAQEREGDSPVLDTVAEEKARGLFVRTYSDKAILLAELSKTGDKIISAATDLEGPLTSRLCYLVANLIDFAVNAPGAEPKPVLIEVEGTKRLRVEFKTIRDQTKDAIGYTQAKQQTLAGALQGASSGKVRTLDQLIPAAVKAAFLAHAQVNGCRFLSVNPKTKVGVPEGSEVKGGYIGLCMPWHKFEPGVHVSGSKTTMRNSDERMVLLPRWAIEAQYAKYFEGGELTETGRVKRASDEEGTSKGLAASLAKDVTDMDTDTRTKVLVAAAMLLRDGDTRAAMRNHPTAKDAIKTLAEILGTICDADGNLVPAKQLDAAIDGEAGWTQENAAEQTGDRAAA